nr:hypothetical protein GCM10020092_018860 [Actinoplanes digitatis]
MAVPDSLSVAQARRITLAAQGFADPAPGGATDMRHLRRVLRRLHLIQMDSVNVLQRAHFMPLYSQLGPYPPALLDRAAYRDPRELFEFWGHEASLINVELQPLFRWRMDNARSYAWGGIRRVIEEQPDLVAWVRDEVADRGPVTAAEIEQDVPRKKDNWGWNWSSTKTALEYLFYSGEVTAAERTTSFARRYDLTERVLPKQVIDAPTPDPQDAFRALVGLAARSLGVAAEPELRDYFRLLAWLQTGRRRADRGQGAAAGHGPGLEGPGLPAPRGAAAAPGERRHACQPVRPADLGARPHRAALRHEVPHRDLRAQPNSGSTATTCSRSCSATPSPPGSTSRPTARPACCASRRPGSSPPPTRRRRPSRWRPSCAGWLAGWAWAPSRCRTAAIWLSPLTAALKVASVGVP